MLVEEKEMYGKDMLTLLEWDKDEIIHLIKLALAMKTNPSHYRHVLSGKILGMIFDKPSTRTRVSFEAGMLQLGGQAIVMNGKELQIGRGEPIKDTANVMSRYIDAIMIRTFSHQEVEELAEHAAIPIINGLTDLHHPCQALADLLTIYEIKDHFQGVELAYVGDGNNVCHSLLLAATLVGVNIRIATPVGYEIDQKILDQAQKLAKESKSVIQLTNDPVEAVQEVDFIYTDVWTSMGQEKENQSRFQAFAEKYQINEELAAGAKTDYGFLHCLPAHRGEEVTEAVIDGPHSLVYEQAANRLHAQKALLALTLEN
ncbi:ornithine carbamoyltransferase [Listeria costaricensis]|uniref:ornithine carbamoyltransferase n=1 Tax=Listeria costaricensis TaxID=2026604 RepID=UPI000C081CC8|nr:ornithine carbamoyltransferase [Listeria costaricensis]